MTFGDLEAEYPWLRLPDDIDRVALLDEFRERLDSDDFRDPCRALGNHEFLRGDALILKRYLTLSEPNSGEKHYVYKLRPSVLASVSLGSEGACWGLAGAPPSRSFWDGDYWPGGEEGPSRVIRRSAPGDRFVYKLAARTGGVGYESESVMTCESSGEPGLMVITTVRENQLPVPGTEVLQGLVRQGDQGECYEYGPLENTFRTPVISRRSPMTTGQYYSTLYCYSDVCCEEHVTVESLEEVTVPAGTFEAFRLRLQSPLPERICWFAPSLNAVVRELVECEGYVSLEVLHEYELGG